MSKFRMRKARSVRDLLEGLGFSEDQIAEAELAGTAELLAIDAVVLPEKTKLTMADVAAKVGIEVGEVQRFWRALGFVDTAADEPSFSKRDVAILKSLVGLTRDGVTDPDVALQVARVIGLSLAQVATAIVDVGATRSGTRGEDEASSLAVRSGELLPFMSEVIDYSFRRHLRAATRRRILVAASADGETQVVGFADLVRFSGMSLQLGEQELAELVGRFDRVVQDIVVRHGGRTVKMMGDGAMFSVVDPAESALLALDLAAAVQCDEVLSGLRIGMASGPVLARDGDLYGPVVNVASRLASVGRAGAINVNQHLRESLAGDRRFEFRSLGQRNLRHIGEMRVYRLRERSASATR
ncbi:MAG: adenylate/guanylate cyclase domain-containing protein [Ilumatobacteraceae bacterium]